MKVSSTQPKFTPFSITIDIESEGEARALYAIFNHFNNRNLLGYNRSNLIRDCIGNEFCLSNGNRVIFNDVTVKEFYIPSN